ncbi:hypothetical protein C8R46DRAFT_1064882 [Mycena filopes]|nr:hypothetical protein C8R46DRAFT_1064882 [Mycena filopes]
MPIIDSEYGVSIADPKPLKVCQWHQCPNAPSGYGDRKMKMCAKCNFVRYCSKEFQRADWSEHRLYCQIPPVMDIGAWADKHRALFRWALIEGLRLRSEPSNIERETIVVNIGVLDRLLHGSVPSPFLVESITRASIPVYDGKAFGGPPAQSREIIEAGGIGVGVVRFNIIKPRPGEDDADLIVRFQYHTIRERPSGEEGPPGMGWAKIARGILNGQIPVSSLSHMVEDGPADSDGQTPS